MTGTACLAGRPTPGDGVASGAGVGAGVCFAALVLADAYFRGVLEARAGFAVWLPERWFWQPVTSASVRQLARMLSLTKLRNIVGLRTSLSICEFSLRIPFRNSKGRFWVASFPAGAS